MHVAQLHGSDGGGGVGVGVGLGVGRGVGSGVCLSLGIGVGFGDGLADDVGVGRAVTGGRVTAGVARSVGVDDGVVCEIAPCDVRRPVALGDGTGLASPPTVSTVAVVALSAPLTTQDPRRPSSVQRRLIAGIWPTQAPKPMVRQRRPTEIFRKARTMAGSNCVPATRVSSWRAMAMLIARL